MADQTPWGFFSYSRHDSEFVLRLAKDLRAAGASVWLDQLDIVPGQHWDSAIEKALGNCPRMLVVLSPDSVESTNVMDEVSYALEENKVVIPILYRDCKTPFRLRRLQYVDARIEYEKGLAQLLGMLGIGGGVPLHPPGTLEEHAHAAEAAAQNAEAEAARLAQEKREAERLANEKAEAARLAAEKLAAEERQRAEAARRAQERAEQEQAARTEQERQARLNAERAQQAAGRVNKPEAPAKSSKIKYVLGAAVVAAILVALALQNQHPASTTENIPHTDVSTTQYPEPSTASSVRPQETPAAPTPQKQSEPDVNQWLKEFIAAGEGPSVDGLRQYYDDVVSPYFGQQSATWEAIAKDKEAYFRRFPTIHYALLAEPEVSDTLGGKALSFDLQYSNVRKDGQTLEGRSHENLILHLVDGRWKVSGISEQVGAR